MALTSGKYRHRNHNHTFKKYQIGWSSGLDWLEIKPDLWKLKLGLVLSLAVSNHLDSGMNLLKYSWIKQSLQRGRKSSLSIQYFGTKISLHFFKQECQDISISHAGNQGHNRQHPGYNMMINEERVHWFPYLLCDSK